jgi:hypothetical protein
MHWLWVLYFDYLWPSLKSNGPEAAAQTIVYGAIAFAVYPPLRRWSKRELEKVHAKLDEAHEKIDHVILHSTDIPPFVPTKGSEALTKGSEASAEGTQPELGPLPNP